MARVRKNRVDSVPDKRTVVTFDCLPCQAPVVIGSVLGLVGPVSGYCDWVRENVWSAASISVWQLRKSSEQICPWDTLACCWDIKQPTNKQTLWHVNETNWKLGQMKGQVGRGVGGGVGMEVGVVVEMQPHCRFHSTFTGYTPVTQHGLPVRTASLVEWLRSPPWERAEDSGLESRLQRDFSEVESYQWLKTWHSSGYPARRLAL